MCEGVPRVRGVARVVVVLALVVAAVVVGVSVLSRESPASRERAVRDQAAALLEGVIRRDAGAVCDHSTARGLTAIQDVVTQEPSAGRAIAKARLGGADARRFCVALVGRAPPREYDSQQRYVRAVQQARDGDARVDVHGDRATIRFRGSPGRRDRGTLTLLRDHSTWRYDHAARSQFYNRVTR